MSNSFKIDLLRHKVHYEQYKTARGEAGDYTFILVHGFSASTYSFRKLIPLLVGEYTTYAVDLIGFGQSEKPPSFRYSYENLAELVIEFIQKLELKNVILVGHSMGGQISLYAARKQPDLILGLVLIGCSGYLRKARFPAQWLSYLPFMRTYIRWRIDRCKVKDILANTMYDLSLIDDEMVQAYTKPLHEKDFCNTLLGLLRYREGDLSPDQLRTISHPTLLIWGEEDRIVPLRVGIRLRQDMPQSTLVTFPAVGHQVMEEKPKEVYREMSKWLTSHGDELHSK
jgi:pimeloyl-ACP methyl ester carboxylesterase